MEIGGPLQHGGIIAREYGIPCVSGLIGVKQCGCNDYKGVKNEMRSTHT